jgi:hypothetical protein
MKKKHIYVLNVELIAANGKANAQIVMLGIV